MTYTYLPYAITEVYCIIFALTVWLRLNSNMGSEHEVRQLRNMIYSYLSMLATDICWALQEDGIIHMPHLLNAALNAVVVMSISCGCYFWFRFIEDRLHFAFAAQKGVNALLKLPLLLVCVLDVASIFTGWLFYIDAGGHYQSTPFFGIHTAVNYFYLVVPTVYALYRAKKTRSKQEKAEYFTYALYMVAPLISGMLEEYFPHVPLLALNIFMMILILFLMIQNMQVYHDALTGLNNRRRLSKYLEEQLPKASEEHPLLFFVLDINNFKAVNDAFGHLEGDAALKLFAGVLKKTANKYYAFAARYGGDEFCIAMNSKEQNPEQVLAEIRKDLEEAQRAETKTNGKYTLSVSAGYTLCGQAENTPDDVFAAADSMLYKNKQEWHARNG